MLRKFGLLLIPAVLVAMVGFAIQSSQRSTIATPTQPTVTISGIDAHDGTVYENAGTYYLIGTAYGCGFTWGVNGTPFCGFHVYSAPSINGPWTYVRELFNRAINSPFHNQTWQSLCGDAGRGCFNPRMVKRPDGMFILSFNAPGDLAKWNANGYYFMGCDGPAGPCGNGSATGSTVKPALYICNAAEDFSIVVDGTNAYIVCVDRNRYIRIEKLDTCWCNGINVGATNLNGLQYTEGVDIYKDPTDNTWIMTFGNNCPYCVGTDTSYATATSVMGPYTTPPANRRMISANSCGGQSRTVVELPEGIFQTVDTWYGSNNETNADTLLIPLERTGYPLQSTPNGNAHMSPFEEFVCA